MACEKAFCIDKSRLADDDKGKLDWDGDVTAGALGKEYQIGDRSN